MAIQIDYGLTPDRLIPQLNRLFEVSAQKILAIEKSWNPGEGTPVFTVKGRYTSRGWTEWTQGFQFGSALLQFDAAGDETFLELGREKTLSRMAAHLTHFGVHDHGFNNVSTYGNLWRLMRENRIPANEREQQLYELALKVSGAVQAARWTQLSGNEGYIYSFNGPHSLFIDTVRSLRALAVGHQLGHVLMHERDQKVSLLDRLVTHALMSAAYSVYYGRGRDIYDVPGRVVHEIIFNINDGSYRCPSSQQGFSPFSTWTRGLAWGLLGFAEQLEFLETISDEELVKVAIPAPVKTMCPEIGSGATAIKLAFLHAAKAAADFYLSEACTDGIPMWDTGAPKLSRLPDYARKPADPFNPWEPVDSSAAAIAAQGFVRLGTYLIALGNEAIGRNYRQAGLTIARTLLQDPYLSTDPDHQGLLLHSVYHRPNGWDYVAPGQKIPNGESSMWGDYHLRELGLLLLREAKQQPYLTFFRST